MLRDRLKAVHDWRKQHEELRMVIVRVLPSGGSSSAIDDLAAAYDVMIGVDVVDVSKSTAA